MLERDKFNHVFADVFDTDVENVVYMKYKEGGWDSVGHMQLITELEKIFGIELKTEDIMAFDSYEAGIEMLKKYGVNL